MTDSYTKGYYGQLADDDTDQLAYDQGVNDRLGGHPVSLSVGRALDTTGVYNASVKLGQEWAADPNKTFRKIVRSLIIWPLIAGAIGYGAGVFLGPSWSSSPTSWASVAAGVMFWFNGLLTAASLAGVIIAGRGTGRAFVLMVVLTLVVVVSFWVVFFQPWLRSLTA